MTRNHRRIRNNNRQIPSGKKFVHHDLLTGLLRIVHDDLIEDLISQLSDKDLNIALGLTGLKLDSKFVNTHVKQRAAKQAIARFPEDFGPLFCKPLFFYLSENMSEEEFEFPSVETFAKSIDLLQEKWSRELAYFLVAVVASTDQEGTPNANLFIEQNPYQFTVEEEISEVSHDVSSEVAVEEESPDFSSPEDIHTPLNQALIKLCIDVAAEVQGAPSREDLGLIVKEYLSLNGQYNQSWYLAGFAAGLDLVPRTLTSDSLARNDLRSAWNYLGYLKGLLRRETTESARIVDSIVNTDCTDFVLMLKEGLGSEIANRIIPLLEENHYRIIVDFLEQLQIANVPVPIREAELLNIIDDLSVKMLRGERAHEARAILVAARDRLDKVMNQTHSELRKFGLADLWVRFTLGIAAASRMGGNSENAVNELEKISSEKIEFSTDRTVARYHFQFALAQSKTANIFNVAVPRNDSEKAQIKSKYAPVKEHLEIAIALQPKDGESKYLTKFDSIYLLSCLNVAEGNFEEARNGFSEILPEYEAQAIRKHLATTVRFNKLLLEFHIGGISTVPDAIERLMITLDSNMNLRSEEVDLIFNSAIESDANNLEDLLDWISSPEQTRHGVPSPDTLVSLATHVRGRIESITRLAGRISKSSERMNALILVLVRALELENNEDISLVLDVIEQQLKSDSNSNFEIWAKFCAKDTKFQEYAGLRDAKLMAASYYLIGGNKTESALLISEIIDSILPVNNVSDFAQVSVLLDELREIAPSDALEFDTNPLLNIPEAYVSWDAPENSNIADEKAETIKILFVGGDEKESGKKADLQAKVEAKYGDSVEVQFFHPGWGSNWVATADSIEELMSSSAALVLMPWVRTNFGRRIRKDCSTNHIPWVPCTSRGLNSAFRAIEYAVNLANSN